MTGVRQGVKYPKASRAERVAWVERVAAEEGEGCRDWPWGQRVGYGVLYWDLDGRGPKTTKVTHITLALSGRPRPAADSHALHSCDRRICAAPWHLRWGSNDDNIADMLERERGARGETQWKTTLTDDEVRAIRASTELGTVLAERYGMHKTAISKIRKGLRWKHVT